MLYCGCKDPGKLKVEIKNIAVVVVLVFFKHIDLCGILADSTYFYTEELIP